MLVVAIVEVVWALGIVWLDIYVEVVDGITLEISQFSVQLFVSALAALGGLVAAKWGVPVEASSAGSW